MNVTRPMKKIACMLAWMLATSSFTLANKLPDPDTSGGIGGTGNTSTKISETLLQPSSANKRHPCPGNLEIANYRLESAGEVSVSAICIGQEIELLHGDQMQIHLGKASEVRVNALGQLHIRFSQAETHKDQSQNFEMLVTVQSGRGIISLGNESFEIKKQTSSKFIVQHGIISIKK